MRVAPRSSRLPSFSPPKRRARAAVFISCSIAALVTVSCARSADSYLKSADTEFKAGKYPDAALEYRKAIQKDAKLGAAYYGLGLTALEQKDAQLAYQALKRASDLLPRRLDVKVKLADLVLGFYQNDSANRRMYDVLSQLTNEMLAIDPNNYDGLRMKGNLALFDRKPQEAIQAFRRANEIKPFQDYLVVGYVQALIQAGQGGEAEQLARQLIDRRKDFGPIYDVLFRYYRSTGKAQAGEAILREKVQNNPGDSRAFIELASYYNQEKNSSAMRAVLEELQQGYASRPDAFLAAGDFYARLGEWNEAASAFEKGSQAEPAQINTLKNRLATVRVSQGRAADALEVLNQLLAKTPTDREAALLKADVLTRRAAPGDLDQAVTTCLALLKSRPNDAAALLGLGKAYMATRDLVSARKALQSAMQSDPAAQEPKLLFASLALREGKPTDALAVLDDLLRRSPEDVPGRYLKINAQIALGRYDEARPELDKLSRQFPQSTDLKVQRGLLAIMLRKYQEAETIFSGLAGTRSDIRFVEGLAEAYTDSRQFDKALQALEAEERRSLQQVAVKEMVARVALQAGQYDRAIGEFQGLLQRQPNSVALRLELGQAYKAKGDLPKAAEQFKEAIQQDPKNPLPYFRLGFALNASGNREDAIRAYRQALALQPNDSLTMNNLAYALAADGNPKDLDASLQLIQHAIQISPAEPEFRDTLGQIWLKKGKPELALQLFTKLTSDAPSDPKYRHHLGLAFLANGDGRSAERALRAALANGPSEAEATEIKEVLKNGSFGR